jgi:hypothetical protein
MHRAASEARLVRPILPTALSFFSLGPARVARRAAEPSPRVRRELYYVIRSGATARPFCAAGTITK